MGLDWTDLAAIMVVMGEPGTVMGNQFHRGQSPGTCNLPQGPGGPVENVGCAIFSENPTENANQVWGRWAHEIGHAYQQGGPAHPSNYNSEFELLDANYPGQTGVFEKQDHVAYPGWLPVSKYIEFNPPGSGLPGEGGGTANLYAMEYDPASKPNNQAAKANITSDLYYLVSVRRRVLGDDTNGDFTPFGIPAEGVLIERVSEGADPWVVLQGPGGDRNDLWQETETYQNNSDGIQIAVAKKIDDDNYSVRISYMQDGWTQPDVALEPWTSPPGNTWETTDIWIDSPINGYNSYRYGFWNDLSGTPVPRLNGDPPTIGLVNHLSARIRNVGQLTATNVVVTFEITDPPGVGIAGAEGWATLGSVDSTDFPGLANILTGDYVDVFVEWTPDFPIPDDADLEDGLFDFHTCLRVIVDPVAGEVVLGNQDGDEEQENIFQVEVDEGDGGAPITNTFRVHNDSLVEPRFFHLSWESDLPDDWNLDVNGGDSGFELGPGEKRDLEISATPTGVPPLLGKLFRVDVRAQRRRDLVNDMDPNDVHHEFKNVGGMSVQFPVLRRPTIECKATPDSDGWFIEGQLSATDFEQFYDPQNPPRVFLVVADAKRRFADPSAVVAVNRDGSFVGFLPIAPEPIYCLFGGTNLLAAAGAQAFGPLIFADGFELGDTSAWTSSAP
jgi:hypothetical protein